MYPYNYIMAWYRDADIQKHTHTYTHTQPIQVFREFQISQSPRQYVYINEFRRCQKKYYLPSPNNIVYSLSQQSTWWHQKVYYNIKSTSRGTLWRQRVRHNIKNYFIMSKMHNFRIDIFKMFITIKFKLNDNRRINVDLDITTNIKLSSYYKIFVYLCITYYPHWCVGGSTRALVSVSISRGWSVSCNSWPNHQSQTRL